MTKQEAEAALGKPVGEGKREDSPPLYACTYETADLDNVSIIVVEFSDTEEAADASQAEIDNNQYKEVSGIGDRAWRPSPIMDISVLKGKYELSIDVLDGGDEEAQFQKARGLAEGALAKLP
ncbi:MAG: hypothetical protein ACUVWR_12270 [Anaerolineae bacterium]